MKMLYNTTITDPLIIGEEYYVKYDKHYLLQGKTIKIIDSKPCRDKDHYNRCSKCLTYNTFTYQYVNGEHEGEVHTRCIFIITEALDL